MVATTVESQLIGDSLNWLTGEFEKPAKVSDKWPAPKAPISARLSDKWPAPGAKGADFR